MRNTLLGVLVVALAAFPAKSAEDPQPKTILEFWDAAYLGSGKAGYVHTLAQEFEKNGQKLIGATIELRLTVKRFQDTIQLGMDTGTFETPEGKVAGVFMKHFLGKSKTLDIVGIVKGDMLHLTLDNNQKPMKPAPWNDKVVGIYRQQRLFQEHNLKVGDEFSYLSFEPSINLVVTTKVQAKGYEAVELFGGKQKKRLLRVESRPNKIQDVQLPVMTGWLGDDLMPVRSEAEIPGLGKITLYRTTKAVALSPGTVAQVTDIGTSQYVKLAKKISRPYETTSALYRITLREDDDPANAFSRDGRQQVKKVQGKAIELLVKAAASETAKGDEKEPGAEFTQSSYFINCNDSMVKAHSKKAVGTEQDSWKKALRIEKWVHDHMKVVSHEALAPADHVARTLSGDCTEFAMLTAAMCRAEGIPSRTAVGLIYGDVMQGPVFAFHMWTEVWHGGRWVPIDATLGQGKVGATHLKIRDQSWHNTYDQTPLLPVIRVLGRVSIEVISAEE